MKLCPYCVLFSFLGGISHPLKCVCLSVSELVKGISPCHRRDVHPDTQSLKRRRNMLHLLPRSSEIFLIISITVYGHTNGLYLLHNHVWPMYSLNIPFPKGTNFTTPKPVLQRMQNRRSLYTCMSPSKI